MANEQTDWMPEDHFKRTRVGQAYLKAKRTNDRKRKSAALDADESSRGSKRHQQQHGAVAQFVSAGKLDNVDNAIRAAVTLRQAVTNGDDTWVNGRARYVNKVKNGRFMHDNVLDACGWTAEHDVTSNDDMKAAKGELLAHQAQWHNKCREAMIVTAKAYQVELEKRAQKKKEAQKDWIDTWWLPKFDDMVAHIRAEAKAGNTVLLRAVWEEFGGNKGYMDEKKRNHLLARLNQGVEAGARHLYVTEPYHNTSVQQQLIVRADRVASCRAAGAEARAAQQMTIVEMVERIEHLKQREEEAQQPDVVARRVASTIVDQLRSSKSRPPGARLSNTVFLDDQSAVASKMLFGILKSQVASSPVLHVSLPLMDPTSGTVRSGAKADLLDGVWTPNPAMAVPSASGGVGSGFAAVIIDFSAVLVRVCATLKRSLAKKRKESKVAICTFGEVVNAALDFSMSLTRRAGAAAMYLAVDPYPSDAEEKTSVKRWSHLDRAKNKISARRYDNIESSTVVVGGPDKLLDALTVSHNKRQLMQLTYSRLSELCLGTEFLRKGESIAWVSDTHGYGKENHFHRRDDVDAGTSSMVDELLSTAPEADFKFGHAIDHWVAGGGAKDPRPVCLWVEDTDVVTHIVTRYWRRCTTPAGAMSDGTDAEEPQQHPGVAFMRGRAGITTYQHVGAIAEHLVKTHGEEAAAILMDVLHGVHVLSGCDYTSFLAGKKKKTFWNVVTSMIQHEKFRVVLRGGVAKLSSEDAVTVDGEHLEVVREVLDNLETFWACLHLPPAVLHKVGESDDATTTPRLGTARTVANPNFLDGEAFPISRAELHEHALRCAYVLKQFRVGTESANAAKDHRSADGWGFEIDKDGYLQVRWVRGNVKTLAQMVGVKTKRGAADAADAAAVPAAAAGPAAEQPGAALTEAEDGEDELDAFWGDDAPPVPIVSAGIPPAGAVPVCNLPIEQGATIATCKDGTWRIGEVTRVELAKVFVQWMADEEGAEEEILRSTLVSKEYGKQWVEISVDMMQQ